MTAELLIGILLVAAIAGIVVLIVIPELRRQRRRRRALAAPAWPEPAVPGTRRSPRDEATARPLPVATTFRQHNESELAWRIRAQATGFTPPTADPAGTPPARPGFGGIGGDRRPAAGTGGPGLSTRSPVRRTGGLSRRAAILVGSIVGSITLMAVAAMPTWFGGDVLTATGTPAGSEVAVAPSAPSSIDPATGTPVATPPRSPTLEPTSEPAASPAPTASPRDAAGETPGSEPDPTPDDPPTPRPTRRATPTEEPTPRPTPRATPRPTPRPTPAPTPPPTPDEHVADFEWSNSGGTRVKFRSLADGEAIHFWLFGDGEDAFGPNPMHRYDQVGTYRVTLVVTWLDGEMERETKDVTVE